MTDYKTLYSHDKNVNTLERGSFNDFGDNTPARQVLAKQAPGETFDVNILTEVGDSLALREEALCPVATETLLVSYLVPTGEDFALKRVLVGGDNIARYLIKVNGDIIASARTWWTSFNANVPFDNLKINSDDNISIYAINRGTTAEIFEATIIGDKRP